MRPGVLCAVPGRAEADLVAILDAPGTGVRVVRRCADLPEVIAAAVAGLGGVAVLGTAIGGLDRAAVARLREAGVRVVLLAEAPDADRARALGADAVLPADAPAAEVLSSVQAAADAGSPPLRRAGGERPGGGARPDGRPTTDDVARAAAPAVQDSEALGASTGDPDPAGADPAGAVPPHGRVVAVWGPHGAPGRTTLTIALASELAALGDEALVADADTWGGCVGQALGLLDESAGLVAATRLAAGGALDAASLAALCPVVEPGLRVLTGISRPDRWRELSPAGLDVVWEVARDVAAWTVVDCGFSLEDEAGAGFEAMLGPRRNGATLSALAAADVTVVVGAAEPVGIQRLVQGLSDLAEAALPAPDARRVVVVTRVRASAAGPRPEQAVTEALVRYAGVEAPVLIPDDRAAYDRALLEGATLRAVAPHSPARAAVRDLALDLSGRHLGTREHRRTGRWAGNRSP